MSEKVQKEQGKITIKILETAVDEALESELVEGFNTEEFTKRKLVILRDDIRKGIESGSAGVLDFKILRNKAKALLDTEKE